MSGGIIFVVILVVAVVAMVAIHAHKKEQERRAALAAYAASAGLRFHPDKIRRFDRQYPEFDFMRCGSNRYAYNLMTGLWDTFELTVFDYHYQTTSSNGKTTTTHHHFYNAIFLRPHYPLTPLRIRRENFFDRMGAAFGFDDIDFESAEFSRQFHVSSPDKKWAFDVVHPRTMDLLLSTSGFGFETDHERLCIWNKGRLNIAELPMMLDFGKRFLDGIPDFRKTSQV